MRKSVSGFSFLFTLTAAIAAVSIFAHAESTTSTTRAAVIDPARVTTNLEVFNQGSLVSAVTGDLIIRISVAVALAEKESSVPGVPQTRMEKGCSEGGCGEVAEPGTLGGNPVNSIDLVSIDLASIDLANMDSSETNPASINVIIAYN